MKDPISIERLSKCHPLLKKRVTAFMEEMERRGLRPRITQGFRTFAEQDNLYAQGRTKPGAIVTNAKGGQSYHNYGYAVDIAFINKDGTVDFNVSPTLGVLGTQFGLEWGGNWQSFKDFPHFQIPGLPSNPKMVPTSELEYIISVEETAIPDLPLTTPAVSPWAEVSFVKAEKKGFSRNNPQDPVDPVRLRQILVKAGFQIQSNDKPVTYEELIVVLDRDGKFNFF